MRRIVSLFVRGDAVKMRASKRQLSSVIYFLRLVAGRRPEPASARRPEGRLGGKGSGFPWDPSSLLVSFRSFTAAFGGPFLTK
jgi:hypothetical protein